MTGTLKDLGAERLSADDLASQREQLFLEAALQQQRRASERPTLPLGICANCEAQCLPRACYCDEECRADHEQRQRVLARQGRA